MVDRCCASRAPSRNPCSGPPNLSDGDDLEALIAAGVDDWGGISPITIDHVNPEAPWPEVTHLAAATARAGRVLVKRLPVYPGWDDCRWLDTSMLQHAMAHRDTHGWARDDRWSPGVVTPPSIAFSVHSIAPELAIVDAITRARTGEGINEEGIIALFGAHGSDVDYVCAEANRLRMETVGDTVTYVVNRNINYTNICTYACGFCAFAKGSTDLALRGRPYDLDIAEVIRRVHEAHDRGATEVCLQGGIHPRYTGQTYLKLARTIRDALPGMHIHAFSPLEVSQGARTLGLDVSAFLALLKSAGLDTLPGTAAEILDDEVRTVICPDKVCTQDWLDVVEAAHDLGLRTTSTIMFGHVERPVHWARHLGRLRALQERTGGITEFVPLPFVHMEAPIALKGFARKGPTFREVRLMHAIGRLALHPLIPNIQVSWVKLGAEGAAACLNGGANDLGGTLMNESISRAAGTKHGQEMSPEAMDVLIRSIGRTPRQRTTLYGAVDDTTAARGRMVAPLAPLIQTPPSRHTAA